MQITAKSNTSNKYPKVLKILTSLDAIWVHVRFTTYQIWCTKNPDFDSQQFL